MNSFNFIVTVFIFFKQCMCIKELCFYKNVFLKETCLLWFEHLNPSNHNSDRTDHHPARWCIHQKNSSHCMCMTQTVQCSLISTIKHHSTTDVCTSQPDTESVWHRVCSVGSMLWLSCTGHPCQSTVCFLSNTPPVQTCWDDLPSYSECIYDDEHDSENDENDDDDAQWGERPYSGYTGHLCSSQWPRCSLHTSCPGVWVQASCTPGSAASRTVCCIWSTRSTRPSLHQL